MSVGSINPVAEQHRMSALGAPTRNEVSFESALRAAGEVEDAQQAREAAAQLVSIALVQPVFAQLREHSLAKGPFAPGDMERRFGPMLDQELAERMTSGAHFPLIDELARRLTSGADRNFVAEGHDHAV